MTLLNLVRRGVCAIVGASLCTALALAQSIWRGLATAQRATVAVNAVKLQ